MSDYYIQNASFIKLDNLTVGYNFNKFLGYDASSRVSLGGQNLLIITKYKGIDPELEKGLDKSIYPRPLMVTLGLNVNFNNNNYENIKKIVQYTFVSLLFFIQYSCIDDLNTSPDTGSSQDAEALFSNPDSYKQFLAKLYAGLATTGQSNT